MKGTDHSKLLDTVSTEGFDAALARSTAIDAGAARRRIIEGLFDVADHSPSQSDRVTALCKLADIFHMTEAP
ncbi:MAG TPA: hypothetical protein VKZ85_14430 [Woeseiaceae bacterium]|nr:hypothetical protein [Woeseiaceae bacterium]